MIDVILTTVFISRVLLYVDGMLVTGSNMQDISVLKIKLAKSFAMYDLGVAMQIQYENNKR